MVIFRPLFNESIGISQNPVLDGSQMSRKVISTSDIYYFVQASRPNVTPPSFPPETFLTRMMEEEVPAPPGVRPDIRRKAVMVQVVRLIFNTPQPSALLTGSLHDDDPLHELVREYEAVRRGSHRIRPLYNLQGVQHRKKLPHMCRIPPLRR